MKYYLIVICFCLQSLGCGVKGAPLPPLSVGADNIKKVELGKEQKTRKKPEKPKK